MDVLHAMSAGMCLRQDITAGKGLWHNPRQASYVLDSSYFMVGRTNSLPLHSVSLAEASIFCVQPRSENIKWETSQSNNM